jgi:hypothetical protein
MDRDDMMKLWAEVQANYKRLEGCVGPHDFVSTTPKEVVRTHERYACLKCKGEVDSHTHHLYKLRMKHGGRG